MKLSGSPIKDGYFMPAEFSPHSHTVMVWPTRAGSFPYHGKFAKPIFSEIIRQIIKSERVLLVCEKEHLSELPHFFTQDEFEKIDLLKAETDDAWARDTTPTFVTNGKEIRGVDWMFNAWGGDFDGLLPTWEKDDALASKICKTLDISYYDCHDEGFVLEGGSIHSDGEGTILVTESCLLSKGRNPSLSKTEIEEKLLSYLGGEKVIWLPFGIFNDETNEHVDNVCAFTAPSDVVLAWTDDITDPQYEMSLADLKVLETETDARGRKFKVHKLPIPKKPLLITEQDLEGYEFADGEDEREVGERLAASYVNFYITNGSVLVPQFDDEHDALALSILGGLFPDRKIVPFPGREILLGGGNIHCITGQIPLP